MSGTHETAGPVKAWIEPDRWAFFRAFPLQATLFVLATLGSAALAFAVHPAFWLLAVVALFRQAAAEASLRELWREGMLHPALVLGGSARGRIATLVRLEGERGVQDAIVISRIPRRWGKLAPPWGGERAAVVIAGQPPRLRPLSPDFAVTDLARARRAIERIPETQWNALSQALAQLGEVREGLHPVELGEQPWYGTLREVEVEGSLPEYLPQSSTHTWCAGLACIEEPEMVAEERARVRAWRRRAWGWFAATAWVAGVLPIGVAAGWGRLSGEGPALSAAWSFAVLLGLITAPFFALSAITWFSRARAYGADLEQGKVLRFAGTLSSFDSLALDPDLALLIRRGMLTPEPGIEQDMVMLPQSGELLYANGKWARPGLGLHVERVAQPPDSPLKLPLPDDVQAHTANALAVARRRLTTPETEELGRHARTLRKPGRVFWILAAFAGLSLVSWHTQAWAWPPKPVSTPIALVAFGLALLTLLKRMRLAARLDEDAALGWVLTVDHSVQAIDGDAELPAQGVETLLHARLDWTVNRRPASWRRFGARREP